MNKTKEELALEYPQLRADIDLCYAQLFEFCKGERNKAVMSIPPQKTDFDMQMSAAFDELKAYRNTGLTPAEVAELAEARRELRVLPKWFSCVESYDRVTLYVFHPEGKRVMTDKRERDYSSDYSSVQLADEFLERGEK